MCACALHCVAVYVTVCVAVCVAVSDAVCVVYEEDSTCACVLHCVELCVALRCAPCCTVLQGMLQSVLQFVTSDGLYVCFAPIVCRF